MQLKTIIAELLDVYDPDNGPCVCNHERQLAARQIAVAAIHGDNEPETMEEATMARVGNGGYCEHCPSNGGPCSVCGSGPIIVE